MQYGYFDDEKREYVITRPDTPAPWANYLGSPEYGAIISNNAGGYSFAKSGANGRILREEWIYRILLQPEHGHRQTPDLLPYHGDRTKVLSGEVQRMGTHTGSR